MNSLFLSLALICAAMPDDRGFPPPTQEQKSLVKQLGDDDFRTREKAMAKLATMMPKSFMAVEDGCKNTTLEIAIQSQKIMQKYCKEKYNKITNSKEIEKLPSYWSLPDNEITIKGKKIKWTQEDIKEGLKKYVPFNANCDYNLNQWAEHRATFDLIMDMIKNNVPDGDISNLLQEMQNQNTCFDCMNGVYYPFGPG